MKLKRKSLAAALALVVCAIVIAAIVTCKDRVVETIDVPGNPDEVALQQGDDLTP